MMENHEFYFSSYDMVMRRFRQACLSTGFVGLNSDTREVGGINFVGCTLWTDPGNPDSRTEDCINDSRCCPDLSHRSVTRIHRRQVEWLESCNLEKSVVVTHHLPSQAMVHGKYNSAPYRKLQKYFGATRRT